MPNLHARKIAQEAADNAAGKEIDPDRAIIAFDRAWEMVYTTAWQVAYGQFLPLEYERLWAEERSQRAQGKSKTIVVENA